MSGVDNAESDLDQKQIASRTDAAEAASNDLG
jgi:hypothetical protein